MQTLTTENYLPQNAIITKIIDENSQIKTFEVVLADRSSQDSFTYLPGQFMMVSVPHCGEAPISLSSSQTGGGPLCLSVRRAGKLTNAMHLLKQGDQIGLRGPYGRPFDMEFLRGRDLLFVAGGIGLAPLRSVINYCLDKRDEFGEITVLYGSRLPSDIAFREDINKWQQDSSMSCLLTVDASEEGWSGPVGLVTKLLDDISPDPAQSCAIVCGPPMMIKSTLNELSNRGFSDENLLTTMERNMKCGVGICRHCHMDGKLVCTDGPVFNLAELREINII